VLEPVLKKRHENIHKKITSNKKERKQNTIHENRTFYITVDNHSKIKFTYNGIALLNKGLQYKLHAMNNNG
jgi:hypothetical protein